MQNFSSVAFFSRSTLYDRCEMHFAFYQTIFMGDLTTMLTCNSLRAGSEPPAHSKPGTNKQGDFFFKSRILYLHTDYSSVDIRRSESRSYIHNLQNLKNNSMLHSLPRLSYVYHLLEYTLDRNRGRVAWHMTTVCTIVCQDSHF